MSMFRKATKAQQRLRMANIGVSGSGKTFTSLVLAEEMAKRMDTRIALVDSEHGKSQLYADRFDFDVHDLCGEFDPRIYSQAIKEAGKEGYGIIVVDSLSHAWDGALQLKDNIAKRSGRGDSFGPWREVTPIFKELIDTILASPAHVICTLRQKTAYEVSKNGDGKNSVDKLGLAPEFRAGVEYEFDVVADMNLENDWIVTKTRYSGLHSRVINRPGAELAEQLLAWLNDGEPPATRSEIEEVTRRLNALADDRRVEAKKEFMRTFGRPDELRAGSVAKAMEFVGRLDGQVLAVANTPADSEEGEPAEEAPAATEPDPAPPAAATESVNIGREVGQALLGDRTDEFLAWLRESFGCAPMAVPSEHLGAVRAKLDEMKPVLEPFADEPVGPSPRPVVGTASQQVNHVERLQAQMRKMNMVGPERWRTVRGITGRTIRSFDALEPAEAKLVCDTLESIDVEAPDLLGEAS